MLLTGEYAVLDGADSLALPTKYGQKMDVKKVAGSDLVWIAKDMHGETWFKSKISLYDFSAIDTTNEKTSALLQKLLKNAVRLNPEFLDKWNGFKVTTHLEFDRTWGLGSSSTLIHLIGQWADVQPLSLFFKCMDGSGYDVACAGVETPIVYYNDADEIGYTPVSFSPKFKDNLYFVYLNQKQSTEEGIVSYMKKAKGRKTLAKNITKITDSLVENKSFDTFCSLIEEHEALIHESTGFPMLKKSTFPNFPGSVKSLGAWGGDFCLAACKSDSSVVKEYFSNRGYNTVLPFDSMILG